MLIALVRQSIRQRSSTARSPIIRFSRTVSDGRIEVFGDFVRSWEPVDELDASEHLTLDTSEPVAANLATLSRTLPFAAPGFTG